MNEWNRCGEIYFEDTEIEAIQEVIQTIEQQTPETMLVPAAYQPVKNTCVTSYMSSPLDS
jgi:hypothetical protein